MDTVIFFLLVGKLFSPEYVIYEDVLTESRLENSPHQLETTY